MGDIEIKGANWVDVYKLAAEGMEAKITLNCIKSLIRMGKYECDVLDAIGALLNVQMGEGRQNDTTGNDN